MTKLTVTEVRDLLLEHRFEWHDETEVADWHDWNEVADPGDTLEVVDLGPVKVWNHPFGHETNIAWLMFQVGDQIFRKEGEWISFAGMYWNGPFTEVKPVQKIITDYEEI